MFNYRSHPMPGTDRVSAVPPLDPQNLYRSHTPTPPPRPGSAPPPVRDRTPTPPLKVTTSVESRAFTLSKRRPGSSRPSTARGPMKPLAAGRFKELSPLLRISKPSSDSFLYKELVFMYSVLCLTLWYLTYFKFLLTLSSMCAIKDSLYFVIIIM